MLDNKQKDNESLFNKLYMESKISKQAIDTLKNVKSYKKFDITSLDNIDLHLQHAQRHMPTS